MACYSPSFMLRTYNDKDGSAYTKFLGGLDRACNCLLDFSLDSTLPREVMKERYKGELSINPVVRQLTSRGIPVEVIQIPCGHCIGCRLDYSRSWADRLTYHSIGKEDQSYFITLTYDDDHLDDLSFSENYGLYSLNYHDMDLFIKSLRKHFDGADLDYYYCGEYGDDQFRPHFHMILFGVHLDDLEYWKLNNNGDTIYVSDLLLKFWKKGFVTVSKFHWKNAAYCAGYVLKKRDGRKLIEYEAVGIIPERCRSSRRPGIAHDYYMDNYEDIWNNNGLSVSRDVNSCGKLGIPRYFRKLADKQMLDHVDLECFENWKKRNLDRSNLISPLDLKNSSFDLDHISDLLKFEEREIISRSKNRSF